MSRASLCTIGCCVSKHKCIPTEDLVKTSKQLLETNSKHIKLDSAIFPILTQGDATTSKLVYVTPNVTYLFLSENACKDLHSTFLDFQARRQGWTEWPHTPPLTTKKMTSRAATDPPEQKYANMPNGACLCTLQTRRKYILSAQGNSSEFGLKDSAFYTEKLV